MSDRFSDLVLYVPHEGTLRVSGTTIPGKCAHCALHYLEKGHPIIDFFCIGANANQQAMKAMGIFMNLVERNLPDAKYSVAFQPLRFKTETDNQTTHLREFKDSTVWRTILIKHGDS